jgi:hypothetical protein
MDIILARAGFLAAFLVVGGAAPIQYHMIGVGTNSCGAWTSARAGSNPYLKLAAEQWVVGYLSGVGFAGAPEGDNPLNEVDADGVWAWMDNYCRAKPLDSIATAGAAFYYAHPR